MPPGAAEGLQAPRAVHGPEGPWEPVRRDLAETGSALVYARLDRWDGHVDRPERLRPLLGRDWDRYLTIDHELRRRRFLVSRLLLRQTVAAVIGTTAELVDLAYQPGGRPYVRGCDQIDVSLSHTADVLAVGVTRRGRIGVDVESAQRRMAGTGSEDQGLTPYERDALPEPEGERNDRLVRLWTLKEAYGKALGQGMRFRFTEFGFAVDESRDGSAVRLVRPDGRPVSDGSSWAFATYPLDAAYVLSVAVRDLGFGDGPDLAVETVLDAGLLDALLRSR